jgi:lipopolysaccharide/colanic/teichoic acid biosynthesis glycosyltransferase
LYTHLKRTVDICSSVVLLAVALPVFVVVAMLIKIEDPAGPVLFRQVRVGKDGRTFRINKFRSMRMTTRDAAGRLLGDSERMLGVGAVIRKLSIDELPQALNILKGEMSFIGPRPLPEKYLDYYTREELARHDVRPGVSGWAQVNGRNMLTWDEKLRLDLYYVANVSLQLDLVILLRTIGKVAGMRDVATRGVEIPDVSLHEIREKRDDTQGGLNEH